MGNSKKSSTSIAIGGVFSAFCLVLMLLSSVFPFFSYASPLLAGAMLLVVVEECGPRLAVLVYTSVSLLSVFMVPDYEAKAIFIGFFGYYPIIRPYLEKYLPKLPRVLVKQVIFNVAMIAVYYILMFVIGAPGMVEDMNEFGKNAAMLLLIIGNFLFFLYDISMNRYIAFYNNRLKRIITKK